MAQKKVVKKHGGARPGAGKKPTGVVMIRRTIRVDEARWKRWNAAAEQADMTLNEWLREAGDEKAGK